MRTKKEVAAKAKLRSTDQEHMQMLEALLNVQPIARMGYTTDEVKKILCKRFHKPFQKWMYGQTCGVDPRLGTLTYTYDLQRYVFILRGGNDFWD